MPEPVEIVQPEEKPASAVVVEHRIEHNMPFVLKWLSYLLLVPLVGVATIAFGCVSLLAGGRDTSGSQQHFIARQWARVLLLIAFSPVKIVRGERLSQYKTAVYASNHLSYFD